MRLKFTDAKIHSWRAESMGQWDFFPKPASGKSVRILRLATKQRTVINKWAEGMAGEEWEHSAPADCFFGEQTGVLLNTDLTRLHLVEPAGLRGEDYELCIPNNWFWITHPDPAIVRVIFLNIYWQRKHIMHQSIYSRQNKLSKTTLMEVEIHEPLTERRVELAFNTFHTAEELAEAQRKQAELLVELQQSVTYYAFFPLKNDPKADEVRKLKIEAATA